MKALLQHAYGTPDTLSIDELDRPAPGAGEVLVAVHAVSLNAADWLILTGRPYIARLAFGLTRPRTQIRGRDLAGTVTAIGDGVTGFAPGDRVVGETSSGSLAEFALVKQSSLALLPAGVSFEQAAACPVAGATALQAIVEVGRVQQGHRVLVNGASGGVGTFAVQLAASRGAEVTAVCSARNADQAARLGATHLIDYATTDFTAQPHRYDVVLDLVGNHSLRALRRTLVDRGTLVLSSGAGSALLGPIGRLLRAAAYNLFVRETITTFVGASTAPRLERLAQLIDAGELTPAIELTVPLEEAAAGLWRIGREHARSKIVVVIAK